MHPAAKPYGALCVKFGMKIICAPRARTAILAFAILAASVLSAQAAGPAADADGTSADTIKIACSDEERPFLGTWSGRFWSYVRDESTNGNSVYRPYDETVVYNEAGCRRDAQTGDTFIAGNETDRYPAFGTLPAKTSHSLLITGRKADGTPFLRTAGDDGTYDYSLVYRNDSAKLAIWQLRLPASAKGPEMTYTTIDGKDFSSSGETRDVTVTLAVGAPSKPFWQGVIAYGSHTKT